MGRLDAKAGRFSANWETAQIHGALHGFQHNFGDYVYWYRFLAVPVSVMDAVYDEGAGIGKVYAPPIRLPVLHVTRQEGPNEDRDSGFYTNDDIHVTAGFDQLLRTGLKALDIETQSYLKDRIVYDDRVFRVTSINVLGQIQRGDVVVGIDATQVRVDELVNDQQFAAWTK